MILLLISGDIHSNPGPQTIIISHANVRSLVPTDRSSRIDEIETTLCLNKQCDIVCISETWIDESISDDDVNIDNYQLFRKDRTKRGARREAGGVAIYCKDDLPIRRRTDLEPNNLELVLLELKTSNKRVIIGSCYRPPNMTADEVRDFLSSFQVTLNLIFSERPESLIILGDFNDKCITWDGTHRDSELGQRLYDLVTGNNLFQLIDEPTHITANTANLLDLLITDSPGYITDYGICAPIGDPHHCCIYCKFQIQITRKRPYTRHIWNYENCDFNALNQSIATAPWDVMDIYDDVNDAESYFSQLFISLCKEHIPNKEITIYPKNKPWMNNEVKKAFIKRDKAHRKWKKHRNARTEAAYKNARHEANAAKYLSKQNYDKKIADKLQDPSTCNKEYWHLSKLVYGNKVKTGIPSIIDDNQIISDSQHKANLFNQHFSRKSKLPEQTPQLPPVQYVTDARLDSIEVCVSEVEEILKDLNISKANGPDNVSNRILKQVANSIARPLAKICNKSLSSGIFPDKWKEAHVSPVFKKSDRQDKNNYRPISLLSNIAKVLERLVFNVLYKYCIENNILTWRNSGYKHLDSTVNQLVFLCHKIYEALAEGKDVCFVSLDASAAFDRVWHEGLLYKLKCYGISGTFLSWIASYLSNRKQRVVIDGSKSDWTFISAGVPQGSILGPLLFLIYVNDIINDIESEILLFADDTCIYEPIADPATSMTKVNSDLDKLARWASQWLVNFNPTKTKYLIFSKRTSIPIYPDLYLDGKKLSKVNAHCHLGLTLSDNMCWDKHIREKCTKALKRVTLLKRIGLKVPATTKRDIYISFIRPLLEYASVIYDNCSTHMSDMLENVQRQAAITITGAYNNTNHGRLLKETGLSLLAKRRKFAKVILINKIIKDKTPTYLKHLLPARNQTRNTRQGEDVFYIPLIKKNYLLKSFIPSSLKLWNDLPQNIRNNMDLDDFRIQIRKTMLPDTFYKPFLCGTTKEFTYLSRLRMGLSGLNAHRKQYHFIDDSTCANCRFRFEDTIHFLLHCPSYAAHRAEMFASLTQFIPNIHLLSLSRSRKDHVFLHDRLIYGCNNPAVDMKLFKIVAIFIKSTNRFSLN